MQTCPTGSRGIQSEAQAKSRLPRKRNRGSLGACHQNRHIADMACIYGRVLHPPQTPMDSAHRAMNKRGYINVWQLLSMFDE